MVGTTRRTGIQALLALVLAFVLAACGGGGSSNQPQQQQQLSNEPVTLKIRYWGNFGYNGKVTNLFNEYKKLHPNVTIQEEVLEYNDAHQKLQTNLASGSGAPDIAAIDEGFIVQFRNQPQNFVNLLDLGADKLKDRWLPWKWQQSLSSDGKIQIGLGTDVGGMAMCYRHDIFKQAGLPTDRDQVSALWPDWNAFIETGRKFQQSGVKAKFTDSGTNVYNAILAQFPYSYFDTADKYVGTASPGVQSAWNTVMNIDKAGLSARLTTFSPDWNAGFQKGAFATLPCPAWMMGYIQGQAPKTKGMWDVAKVPNSGGNWGGSFLTIPKQGKHAKEAFDLITWLTAPEQELVVFKETGNLPSIPALYTNPSVTSFKNEFFNNAPVGQIFSDAAKALQPQYLGTNNGPVRQQFEAAIQRVEQGKQPPEQAFAQANKDGERAAAG